jgi:hypothetical protein
VKEEEGRRRGGERGLRKKRREIRYITLVTRSFNGKDCLPSEVKSPAPSFPPSFRPSVPLLDQTILFSTGVKKEEEEEVDWGKEEGNTL